MVALICSRVFAQAGMDPLLVGTPGCCALKFFSRFSDHW